MARRKAGGGLPHHELRWSEGAVAPGVFDFEAVEAGEQVRCLAPCPYCRAEGDPCEHLLVAADRTFGEYDGEAFARYVDPALARLERALGGFLARVARLPRARRDRFLARVEPARLRALLYDVIAEWPDPEDEDLALLETRARWDYLEGILLSCGDTLALEWSVEDGPGLSTDRVDFWSGDPAAAAREAARLIQEDVAGVEALLG